MAVLLLMLAPLAPAQEESPATPARTESPTGQTLPEVVVEGTPEGGLSPLRINDAAPTAATGLPLTLKETPQSVSIIDRSRIETEALRTQADVLRNTAGVYVTYLDSERTAYYSRGFEITELKVDGLRSGTATAYASMPEDMAIYESVQVIRGSDGLLTGAGNPSATVNLIRKRPTRDFGGYIEWSAGSWDFRRMEADINLPLNAEGTVRTRFVGVGQDTGSFRDRYSEEKWVAYGVIEADLGDYTTLSAGYSFQSTDPRATSWGAVPYFTADGSLANLPRSTNWATDYSRIEQRAGTAFVQLEHEFENDWTLQAKYSHIDITKDWKVAYAGGGVPNLDDGSGMYFWRSFGPRSWGAGKEDVNSFLFDLAGPVELFGRKHDIAAGFNYYHAKLHAPGSTESYSWPEEIPDIRHYNFNQPEPKLTYTGAWDDVITEDFGTYASIRLNPADCLKVILGGRLSVYETYLDSFNSGGGFVGRSEDLKADDVFTPYVGVVVDITDTLSAYASYTDIFDPQRVFDYNRNLYDPVRGETYEGGLKKVSADGRWLATASVFQTGKSNSFETDWTAPFADGSYPSMESGPIVSQGVEFEVNAQVTDDWSLYASYTHVSTEDEDGDDASSNEPDNLVKLFTHYRLPGKLEKLSIGGGMRWQSGINNIYWSGVSSIEQGGYAVFDLNAHYKITENLSASVALRNLFDEHYFANVGFYDGVYHGEPFNVQFSLKYSF